MPNRGGHCGERAKVRVAAAGGKGGGGVEGGGEEEGGGRGKENRSEEECRPTSGVKVDSLWHFTIKKK